MTSIARRRFRRAKATMAGQMRDISDLSQPGPRRSAASRERTATGRRRTADGETAGERINSTISWAAGLSQAGDLPAGSDGFSTVVVYPVALYNHALFSRDPKNSTWMAVWDGAEKRDGENAGTPLLDNLST